MPARRFCQGPRGFIRKIFPDTAGAPAGRESALRPGLAAALHSGENQHIITLSWARRRCNSAAAAGFIRKAVRDNGKKQQAAADDVPCPAVQGFPRKACAELTGGSKGGELLRTTFRALQYRDFRLFWFGQCISLTGTWVQRTAQTWLVYSITRSPLDVGLLGVAQFLPLFLFSLFAGSLVDRFSKKKLLLLTQTLFMLQAVMMTALTAAGGIRFWHILALSFLFGLTQTLDMPARQSYFIDMVGKKDLTNAISLNSTIVNLARILGPSFAGLIMLRFGDVFCFFLNAVSFIPVILGVALIHAQGAPVRRSHVNILPDVAQGLRYIRRSDTLIVNVLVMAAVCTFAMNTDVIIPVFARTVLRRGADGYTLLLSAAGLGAFLAAVTMAYVSKNGVKRYLLPLSGLATGLLQALTVLSASYPLSAVLVALVGFSNLVFINTANSVFQLGSSDEYRGRVMSVYSFLNLGSTPIGNFLSGAVMERFGGDSGFLFCGAATLALLAVIGAVKRRSIREWLPGRPDRP